MTDQDWLNSDDADDLEELSTREIRDLLVDELGIETVEDMEANDESDRLYSLLASIQADTEDD